MTDADYDYIMDEIERREKLSLKGMWVLTVMMNVIDDNNNNAIFNVGFHYIIIKNEYVNIIWIFILFSEFSRFLDRVLFIPFKYYLVPNCI